METPRLLYAKLQRIGGRPVESENSPANFSSQNHYHIRWSDSQLDWCAFPTEDKAKTVAKGLARRGESYAIEQYDVSCKRCKEFKSKGMV